MGVTSTLLDVTLFLLLVGAAAGVVVTAEPASPAVQPDAAVRADDTATTLATSTANVSAGAEPHPTKVAADESTAVAHDTLANHLVAAAVGTTRIGGATESATEPSPYRRAVTDRIRATLPPRTQVVVAWRPYPNASIGSRYRVGPRAPESATVHAATQGVPTGVPAGRAAALAAADGGFEAVAAVIATRVVDGLFPPRRTALALGSEGGDAKRIRGRYRRIARELGVDAGRLGDVLAATDEESRDGSDAAGPPSTAAVADANRELTAALADRVERDIRGTFDDPRAAARAVDTERAVVLVRTWSA